MTPSAPGAPPNPTEQDTRTELMTREPAEALAGLLDIDLPSTQDLPPLWHWVYMVERRPQRDLGPDGHPTSGIPAPPGPGRLRMFAGGRVQVRRPLRFGEPVQRTTRVVRTAEKQGRSGPLTFLTVRIEFEQAGSLAIADEQDIVYRDPGSTLPLQPHADVTRPEPAVPVEGLTFRVDPVVLFRFSALTYNAHRIHYDLAYAQREGYPDLVVHGPLQALLMGELMRRAGESFIGQQFTYRLVAPTFGEQRLAVSPDPQSSVVSAQVTDIAGRVTARSTLDLPGA
jgi:3-methylfumaryl-CoA hydratase